MDFLLELILEIILEGAIDAVTETKIPLLIRILLAVALLALYLGFAGAIIYFGISSKNALVIAIGIFVLLLIAFAVCCKYKKLR